MLTERTSLDSTVAERSREVNDLQMQIKKLLDENHQIQVQLTKARNSIEKGAAEDLAAPNAMQRQISFQPSASSNNPEHEVTLLQQQVGFLREQIHQEVSASPNPVQ